MIVTKRKAKKEKVCYFCLKKIKKGEEYYQVNSPYQKMILGIEAICLKCYKDEKNRKGD